MLKIKFKFLILLCHYVVPILSDIISKSNIELCTSSNITDTCTQKLVLSLSIQNGKLAETDSMEVYISSVNDLKGDTKLLQNPYRINIQKSPVYLDYPCIYAQDFNYHPAEQIIQSDVFSCNDGDLSPNPTCGWQFTNNKITIPYSQGFCCKCDFGQIIGVDTTSRNRGNSCDLLNIGAGSASAHCLRFDKLWYSAYEIQPYQVNYSIDIVLTYKNDTKNFTAKSLSLSPSNLIALSEDNTVTAKLIGDFSPQKQPNDYSSYYLVIPTSPPTHQMVLEGPTNWMILPKDYFTLDGRECNKIGVSYYAFRTQNVACKVKIGECLNNQIYDYYKADLAFLSDNKTPKYLIFSKTNDFNFYSYSDEKKKFSEKLDGVFNTLITLEIKADDIKFYINVSNGIIDYAIINTFESLSSDGVLQTQITNSGNLTALFYISYNCTDYLLPIQSDELTLSPFQSDVLRKDIYTLNSDFKSHSCNLTLKNSIGEEIDFKSVSFNSTKVVLVNVQSPNNNSTEPYVNGTTEMTSPDYEVLTCQQLCPGFFDFLCFVAHGCWGYLARTLGIILLAVIVIIFIIKWIRNGGLCKCIDKCVNCLSFNDNTFITVNKTKTVYLNFDNNKFDFSNINICYDFSVEAKIFYNDIKGYMDITNVIISGSFKYYVDNYYNNSLNVDEINTLIANCPNFITDKPLYRLIK
jgi:hypothetical protein